METLNNSFVNFPNQEGFAIVHDMCSSDFRIALDSWLFRTGEFTAESLVDYVKDKEPNRFFLTKADYDEQAGLNENIKYNTITL